MEQEILQRAMMLRQQSEEVEKQLGFVNGQIAELEKFSGDLEVLSKNEEKEILANLGRGVYAKTLRADEKLFVEVGAGVVIRKTPEEAKKIIEGQISKFNIAKVQLTSQMEEFIGEFEKIMEEIQDMKNK